MKKSIVFALSALLTVSTVSPANAAEGDAWVPSVAQVGQGNTSFFIAEDTQGNLVSTRTAGTQDASGVAYDYWCDDYKTEECDLTNSKIWFTNYAVLPVCKAANQENCVARLVIQRAGESAVEAKFVRNVDGIKFGALPELGLYEASTISLWDAPGAPSAGGKTTYAVNVRTRLHYDRGAAKFRTDDMTAIVMPYRVIDGQYSLHHPYTVQNAKGTKNPGVAIDGIAQECVWNDAGHCGVLQNFAKGTKVHLETRISNEVGGWFKGRMARPNIAIARFSATANTITVESESVDVPRLQVTVSKESAPANVETLFVKSGVMGPLWGGWAAFADGHGDFAFDYLNAFKSSAKDTAAGVSNLWSFGTVQGGAGSPCLADTDKVLGIVTTNSTIFDGSAPAFERGSLKYRVGGLHYLPDGSSLTEGTYDLVMRSETARCLYGFSKAPISATISVVSDQGENKVATTVVNELDGWLHLAAYGFTYSSPTISVKITQAKAPAIRTTITCAKGKLTKKVTGLAPKCPAGYKKR